MSKAKEAVSTARRALVLDQPFFGVLSLKLELVEDKAVKTLEMDGRKLWFNPAYVESLSKWELIGVIAHEVLHCANGHVWRAENRDLKRWNHAADYAINPIVLDAGMVLPKGMLDGTPYKGQSAEEIYERLMQQPPSSSPESSPDGEEGESEEQEDESNQPQEQDVGGDDMGDGSTDSEGEGNADPDSNPDNDAGNGEGEGEDDQGGGESTNQGDGQQDDQSGDGNGDGSGESGGQGQGIPDGSECGQIRPCQDDAQPELQADWSAAVLNAAKHAQGMGRLPKGLERLVEEIKNPPQDWKAILRRFVQANARDDYSWQYPNPRYMHLGLYLPAMRSESMPPIVVGVDTSGSIDEVLLGQFFGEIESIVGEVKPEKLHVVYCDDQIQGHDEFDPGEDVTPNPKGFGGTDFKPVFDYLEQEGITPACLVYLTDMLGSFPAHAPDYPVLWGDTEGLVEAPFGETVRIRPE